MPQGIFLAGERITETPQIPSSDECRCASTLRPFPCLDRHLHAGLPEIDLVAGEQAHAAAVLGADVDRAAVAQDSRSGGAGLGAQAVFAGFGVPEDARLL